MRSLRNAKSSCNKVAAVECAVIVFLSGTVLMMAGISTIKARVQGQPTTGKFRRVARPIPNQYIVVLNDDIPSTQIPSTAVDLARTHGGSVKFIYRSTIKGFSIHEVPEAVAVALSQDSRVDFIEENGQGSLDDTQVNPPWGLDRIDQRGFPPDGSYTYSESGTGVTAYVIDNGVRTSHGDFGGRASLGGDCIEGDANCNGGSGQDCTDTFPDGHGTPVAAILGGSTHGIAKNITIKNVRVCDCAGSCPNDRKVAGIEWVTNNQVKPAVANMSLSTDVASSVDKAVRKSIAAGVVYVVSAGNNDIDASLKSPAGVTQALTVGATGNDSPGANPISDRRASFSNKGLVLDLFAPGVETPSASAVSDTATVPFGGTSASSPHVAGAVARYLQTDPPSCPSTVSEVISSQATTNVVTEADGTLHTASPNRLLFTPLSWPAPHTFHSRSMGLAHMSRSPTRAWE